ncbi:MAG: TolC family protein [Gemmatimonadota bacterium]|nr:TolC family protein [Gemmatimonadota bacterium]
MHRTLALLCFFGGLAVAAADIAVAQAPASLDDPNLRRYVEEVLARNAGLAAADLETVAATERMAPAGALPDPVLQFGAQAVPVPSFDFDEEAMTQLPIGIRQDFPSPGKQGARTDVARQDSSVAVAGADRMETELSASAARVYFELAYASTAEEIWRSRVELAGEAVATARVRYATGGVPQVDLLRAEVRRARLVEMALDPAAEVEAARARADALRGGPGATIEAADLADDEATMVLAVLNDTLPGIGSLEGALDLANPDLRVARARVERARSAARVFAIAARPDFYVSLQTGVRFGDREPLVSAVAGLSLPLWSGRKQDPASRAATLAQEAEEARYEDLRARLGGEVRARRARLDALRGRVQVLRDEVLPLAAAASESGLASYATGETDLTTVLAAQDELFEARLQLARLVAGFGAERAALAALLGEEWYR